MKILLQYNDGRKEIREIPAGAKFETAATVLWGEGAQGPIPADVLAAFEAEKAKEASDEIAAVSAKEKVKSERRARLKDLSKANTLPELKALLKDIVDEMGI